MPDGLYERDILLWAEGQAGLLRRLAAGERVNDAVDWANLIDEVEDVGRSELHSCESLIMHALEHLLKLAAWPDSADVPHWRGETVTFLADAQLRYAPSMRARIDMDALFALAVRSVRARGGDVTSVVTARLVGCPFTVDELLEDVEFDALLEHIVWHGTA